MNDKNGKFINLGDVVKVAGGYSQNNNGLFFVTDADDDGRRGIIWLKRLNKDGTLSQSAYATQEFPPVSYMNDPRKRREARDQNRTATIEKITEGVNLFFVAEWFRAREKEQADAAARYREAGWTEDEKKAAGFAKQYAAAAERSEQKAEQPPKKAPFVGIRFYYNGIKVDDGKLKKCRFSLGENSVTIYAADYSVDLPRQYFPVENNSDGMTDYFEKDRAMIGADHPLYRFARYAALKTIITGRTWQKPTPAQRAEWERTTDPGQPTEADLRAVEEMNSKAEADRLEKEAAEQKKARDLESIVKITPAPWLEQLAAAKQEAAKEREEAKKRLISETLAQVELLTTEQLVAAVFQARKDQIDVARFFAQQIARRDPRLGVETFKKWKEMRGV